jgi:hypothetical protein
LVSAFFVCGYCLAQTEQRRNFANEITITIDNDIFLFSDWYYTAGHKISYRKLLGHEQALAKLITQGNVSSKAIVSFNLGNKIFTPKRIQFANSVNMDRPYAGFEYGSISISRLKGKRNVSSLEFEIGLIGKATGLGKLQQWWHAKTGLEVPRGWNTQIANEVVLNMNYRYERNFKIVKYFDLVSTSGVFFGTGSNKITQDLRVRLINFNPITESLFSNNRLAFSGSPDKEEVFIFGGIGIDYVISNIFLEGSLFKNNQSFFTVNATPWVLRSNFGIMYARNRGSFALSVNNLAKEVAKGSGHSYVGLAFSLRF